MLGPAHDQSLLTIDPIVAWRFWALEDNAICSPYRGDVWVGGKLEWDLECRCAQQGIINSAGESIEVDELWKNWHWLWAVEKLAGLGAKQSQMQYVGSGANPQALAGPHPPKPSCHCGINAYASQALALESVLAFAPHLVGEVELTGTVHQFERGWRGQAGRIISLGIINTPELFSAEEDQVREIAQQLGARYLGVLDPIRRDVKPAPAAAMSPIEPSERESIVQRVVENVPAALSMAARLPFILAVMLVSIAVFQTWAWVVMARSGQASQKIRPPAWWANTLLALILGAIAVAIAAAL